MFPPTRVGGGCITRRDLRLLRPLRKKHDLPAVGTLRKMSKHLHTLMAGQNAFGKGAELICVRMLAGMETFAHGFESREHASSLNGRDRGVCRRLRRLMVRSRGSVPSASSAPRLLRPEASRLFRRRLRTSTVRRLSLRLTVASCTR